MQATVITIPARIQSRGHVQSLFERQREVQPTIVLNCFEQRAHTVPAAEEIVRQAQTFEAQQVVVVNATDTLEKDLRAAHRRLTRPGAFLLTFQTRPEETLLRTA